MSPVAPTGTAAPHTEGPVDTTATGGKGDAEPAGTAAAADTLGENAMGILSLRRNVASAVDFDALSVTARGAIAT